MNDAPHGPDWRATPSADERRGWLHPAVLVIAAGVVAAVAVGLLYWVRPVRPAAVLGVAVSAAPDGAPVPFADLDFRRLADLPLPKATSQPSLDPTRDQLRTTLAALARHPADQPLVVYLGGAADFDDAGQLVLAAGVPGADHGRNRVTLAEVLEQVRAAPTPHKLLVLDLDTRTADWVPAATAAIESVPDPRRLVLFARGPGERSHFSDVHRGSVFARYWAEGVRTADGWNPDGSRDNRVSVAELAAFVRARVARWAERNRATPQTPWLTGTGGDFVLGPASAPTAEEAAEPTAPAKLFEAWAVQDAWLTDGRADRAPVEFARLQQALMMMERDWAAGRPAEVARRRFDTTLAAIDRATATVLAPTVPDMLLPAPTPDAAQVEQLRRYLVRNEAVAEPTEKPPTVTPAAVLAVAAADPPPSALQLKRLAKLLGELEPEPSGWPSLLLRRVGGSAEPAVPERAARLLRDTLELESVAQRVGFFPWGRAGLERADARWSAAVTFTGSPNHAAPADADRSLTELETDLRTLAFAADAHRNARSVLRRGERVLAAKSDAALSAALERLRAALAAPTLPPDLPATATAATGWDKLAGEAEAAIRAATPAFQPNELAAARRKAEATVAGPRELADLDRLLAYPLLPAAERVALWAARLALAKKLDDEVSERDRQDADDFAAGRRTPDWTDPREPPIPRTWSPMTADRHPVAAEDTTGVRREFLSWHAGRFEYLARNPFGLPDATVEAAFAARALDQCRRFGATPPPSPRLEIQASGVALTPAKRSAVVPVQVRLLGAEAPVSTAIDVLTPSVEWVIPAAAGPVVLSPVRAVTAERTLTVGPKPERHPTLRGVLARAEVGGRAFFRRVPVNTDALSNRLDLLVAAGPDAPPVPAVDLRVRPNGRPAKFDLLLSNPTAAPQTVLVKLANPARETAPLTLAPGEVKPLAFPAPPPAAPAPAVPPPAIPAAPTSEFAPAPAEFRVELLDPKTRDVRQSFALPVRVTEPAELLDVREVLFTPIGKAGQLAVVVAERQTFAGGPVPVALAFPDDRNPGLVVPDGKLSGTFEPGGAPLRLYAQNLKFDPPGGRTVTLAVAADGVERAFTFVGEVAATDAVVRFQPVTAPRVRIRCDEFATGTAPLPVRLDTDNAPPTATLDIRIGTEAGGEFRPDFTHPPVPAKDRGVGVAFDPKGGLTLRATVADPELKLPVNRLVGRRVIRARLLDANGKELARDARPVVFDGSRPQDVRFVDPPVKVPADKPLSLRATCDRPVSGVKEVHFFAGKPVSDAPPPTAVLIAGKPTDDAREWTATLPLDGAKTPLDVSVRFTSRAGLIGFATVTVERADAAELNKPEPAAVKGTVVEGTLPQPGLAVVLFDDKGKEKAKAKTKDDGSFAFADLPAGKYRLFAEKTSTGREKSEPVELKPGDEKAVTLRLLLK